MIESRYKPPRRRRSPTGLESLLLFIGLAALAFAAGTGGWVIGRHSTSSRVSLAVPNVGLTATGEAPATPGAVTTAGGEETAAGDATAGKEVFVGAGCGSCHALKAVGAGGTVGPNLDQTKLSPGEIIDWVAKGEGAMPSFKSQLTETQIQDVAAFIVQSTSEGAGATTGGGEETVGAEASGEEIFASAGCGSCHTLKAAGATGKVGPNLDKSNLSLSEIVDWVAEGAEDEMPAFKDQLTKQQIKDVAAFVLQSISG